MLSTSSPALFYGSCAVKMHVTLVKQSAMSYNQRIGGSTTVLFSRRTNYSGMLRFNIRHNFANYMVNQYKMDDLIDLGPDLACLRWLFNCGATSVNMSDGTTITSQRQMRTFIDTAIQQRDEQKRVLAPRTELVKAFESERLLQASLRTDVMFAERWPDIPNVFINEVDATDAALTDRGFAYFTECRQIRKLKLNFCDYFGNSAIRQLAMGRPARTLYDLEITMNPRLSDSMTHWLTRLHNLKRLHLYFLPYVVKRDVVLRELRSSLPFCRVTFPETRFIGYGYDDNDDENNTSKSKQSKYERKRRRTVAQELFKETD